MYDSIEEIVSASRKENLKISEVVLRDQALSEEKSEEELYKKMEESFDVMCESVKIGSAEDLRSVSGLTGGESFTMNKYASTGGIMGEFTNKALARTLAVANCNAAMGKIVACPTAGSSGILPGCLVSLYEDRGVDKKDIVMSMFTSAAFGMVIAKKASVSGAQGGCQAECGSASAMAAAALVEIMGGSAKQCADAAAMAIANQLGLVCDPVAGLVEIPCIKRNAGGLMIAFSSAEMALAGIPAYIPVDECIDAMREVGDSLPSTLKETSGGGLAVTPTAIRLREKVFGRN